MATLEQKVKYVYNSNRLDGVYIPYEKTLELLSRPKDPLDQSVDAVGADKEEFERAAILSHFEALNWTEKLGRETRPYVEGDILGIHRRLMEGVILSGGEYRECTLKYRAVPPVAPQDIAMRMRRVLGILNLGLERAKSKELLAWQVHHEFLYVHPFIEGNGRTARLLLNLVRFRSGLDLELIPFAEHEKYLRSIVDYGNKMKEAQARAAAPTPAPAPSSPPPLA